MSTPLIPDGIYKIFNVKYSGFAVDLISGNPFGTVSGFTENTSENQEVCTDSQNFCQGLDGYLLVR